MPAHEQVIEELTKDAISNIDTKSIFESFWEAAPPEFSLIITLTKYLFILLLIYFFISIIVKLLSLGTGRKLKVIVSNIVEINEKLDSLIEKLRRGEKKKKEEEK